MGEGGEVWLGDGLICVAHKAPAQSQDSRLGLGEDWLSEIKKTWLITAEGEQ